MLILACLFVAPVSNAQGFVETGIRSLDTPVDPRTVAMGESFVAIHGNQTAFIYNPAGTVGIRGVGISYSQRRVDWTDFTSDFKYHSLVTTLQTPICNVALTYARFDQGEFTIINSQGADIGKGKLHDYVIGLSASRRYGNRVALGIAVKTFDISETITSGSVQPFETTRPILFDIGALFDLNVHLAEDSLSDTFTIGVSLQNFGTDFRTREAQPIENNELVKLPRYLRLGFSYSVKLLPHSESSLTPFMFLLTGEYRNLLNGADFQDDDRDFWGFGVEATFFEIIALRIGGYVSPYNSIYGRRGTPSLRYGVGLIVPFSRMGITLPFSVRIDYAGIPLHDVFFFSGNKKVLDAFGLGVMYDAEIF